MKYSIFTLVILITINQCFAQSTNFSGNWVLSDQQSISGNLYSNAVPRQLIIKQEGATITMEKETLNMDNTASRSIDTLNLQGKAFETLTPSKRKKIITLQKNEDGTALLQDAILYNIADPSKIDFKIWDKISIENGNLIIVRKNQNFMNGEVWECRAVYKKQ